MEDDLPVIVTKHHMVEPHPPQGTRLPSGFFHAHAPVS